MSCGFPRCGSFVGFPIDGDVAVAPILRAKPFNGGMDSLAFTIAPVVETTGALFSSEDGNLSQSIAVGYEIVIDEFAAPGADPLEEQLAPAAAAAVATAVAPARISRAAQLPS